MPPAPINYLHTVLFSFNPGTPEATRKHLIDSIHAQGRLPQVASMLVAPNLACRDPATEWEWVLMLDFASEALSREFQSSAAHQAQIAADFAPNRRGFIMLDLHQPFDRTIVENGGNTYRRIGMFNLKPDIPAEEQQRIMAELAALGVGDPGVGRVLWGRNSYPENDYTPYDWMIVRDFADPASYAAFDASPARQSFLRETFSPAIGHSLVLEIVI